MTSTTPTPSPPGTPRGVILTGDALDHLQRLPAGDIDCIVTSPPYFRLRDYGVDRQLGLEADVDSWVAQLLAVTSELARLLIPTGTLWLNLGDSYSTHPREGAPRKSLVAAPERLLLALLDQGWIIRNKLIWAKTNPIPSSVPDRLSTTYEVIYLLTRHPRYYFDLDDIRQPLRSTHPTTPRPSRRPPGRHDSRRPAWLGPNSDTDRGLAALHAEGRTGHPLGKNPGDVWQLATSSYRGAHFATYPEALVERILRAGCPEQRCTACRSPWRRTVHRLGATAVRQALRPGCRCDAPAEPGLVLDPFLGSGTTAVVAERLGRDWCGIELNPAYVDLAWQRLHAARQPPEHRHPPRAPHN